VLQFLKKYDYTIDFLVYISENIRIDAFGESTEGVCD